MKAVVAAFNQEKALVGAFSVITNLRMDLRFKLYSRQIKLNLRRAEEIRTLDFEVEFKILGFRINMILGLGGRLALPLLSHRQLSPCWTKLPGAGTLC